MTLFNLSTKSNRPKKQSSALWYKEKPDVIIFVADGWNHATPGPEFDRQWLEPITEEEFLHRRDQSICLAQTK